MEIFNSIWTALSTPNEGLLNILTIPLFFVEAIITMLLFLNITPLISTRKQKTIYPILISFISIFNKFIIPNPFNIFINYFMMILLSYIIFRKSFLKTCASMIISLILFNMIGIFILNPFITILSINTEQLNSIPIYRISYILTIYILKEK